MKDAMEQLLVESPTSTKTTEEEPRHANGDRDHIRNRDEDVNGQVISRAVLRWARGGGDDTKHGLTVVGAAAVELGEMLKRAKGEGEEVDARQLSRR